MFQARFNKYSRVAACCLLASQMLASGCGGIFDFLLPPAVTVRLSNNGTFPVQADVAFSSDPNITRDALVAGGTHLAFTIPAGQDMSFSRSCVDLQAVAISDATLDVTGGSGPHT